MNLGQLFLAGFDGIEVDGNHSIVKAIVHDGLGGVILFDRNVDGTRQNISSPAQLRGLTAELQHYGKNSLLIAVDQEGGKVCRLKEADGFPSTESAASLSAEETCENVHQQAKLMAASLRESGINFNLAPVVDLNLNQENPIIAKYERSYSTKSVTVVRCASQFITAHHAMGVACCIKHFPGHGSAKADSHLGFVDITACWQEKELEPFAHLIESGFSDAVMTAHVVHGGMDKDLFPATLSQKIITGLLRKQLGFDGVVVSDDLQMKAISDRWGYEEAVQKAVLAGVDLLVVGNNLVREQEAVVRGVRAITELIDSGRIAQSDVQASLDRIATLKQKIAGAVPWKKNQPII